MATWNLTMARSFFMPLAKFDRSRVTYRSAFYYSFEVISIVVMSTVEFIVMWNTAWGIEV